MSENSTLPGSSDLPRVQSPLRVSAARVGSAPKTTQNPNTRKQSDWRSLIKSSPLNISVRFQNIQALQFDKLVEVEVLEPVLAYLFDELGSNVLHFSGDHIVDINFEPGRLQSLDVFCRHALHSHGDQVVATGLEACRLNLSHIFRTDALNLHTHQVVAIRLQTEFMKIVYVGRCDALDFHGDNLIGIGVQTCGTKFLDVSRSHSLHFESNDLVR